MSFGAIIRPLFSAENRDIDEARAMAREAIELYLESLEAAGQPIPTEDDTLESMVTVLTH
jgi:predicted RNase H-like HicB family nuclease